MKKLYFILLMLATHSCFSQATVVKENVYIETGMFEVNGSLLFAADTGTYTDNLWISDGTTGGTHVLKKFSVGMLKAETVGFSAYTPIVFKNNLYFLADDDGYGIALWKSDGTLQGTVLVKYFGAQMMGPYNDSYPFFCILNDEMLFAAGDNAHGVELWKTDGTTNGTVLVKDITPDASLGSQPAQLTVYKNEVYFSCFNETYGVEIWKSDGTEQGTTILKDIFPGLRGVTDDSYLGSIDPQFTVSGNYLFFTGHKDTIDGGTYLYRTDGTAGGTIILDTTNIRYDPLDYHKPYQADVNGTFMYMANGSLGNSSLYKSDGTPAGTVNVTTNNNLTAYGRFLSWNGKLYFHGAQGPNNSLDGLCVSDGTMGGTLQVAAFPYIASSPDIAGYVDIGSSFFFRALMTVEASTTEWRMVQSNGTANGTHIYHGDYPSGSFTFYNGAIYYFGIDSATDDTSSLYKLTLIDNLEVNETKLPAGAITVFPNPADESVVINTSTTANENSALKIFNLVGENTYNAKLSPPNSNVTINVSNWENGIYFCTVQQNESVRTIKMIVQH